jgi:hypothetical protein
MISLYLSRAAFDFLAGTGFREDLDDVFKKLETTLKRKDFTAARHLDRKIFDVNEAPHIYEGRIEHVNEMMTALLREERLRVTHGSVARYQKPFVLEPLTLVIYKKGLCLAGYSHHHNGIRTFSLDGFRDVDWLRGERFEYPADYHPSKLAEGAFGLISGPRTRARITQLMDLLLLAPDIQSTRSCTSRSRPARSRSASARCARWCSSRSTGASSGDSRRGPPAIRGKFYLRFVCLTGSLRRQESIRSRSAAGATTARRAHSIWWRAAARRDTSWHPGKPDRWRVGLTLPGWV